jgi:hypothetical protein
MCRVIDKIQNSKFKIQGSMQQIALLFHEKLDKLNQLTLSLELLNF